MRPDPEGYRQMGPEGSGPGSFAVRFASDNHSVARTAKAFPMIVELGSRRHSILRILFYPS